MRFTAIIATALVGTAAAVPLTPDYVLDSRSAHLSMQPRHHHAHGSQGGRLSAPAERPPPHDPEELKHLHAFEDMMKSNRGQ